MMWWGACFPSRSACLSLVTRCEWTWLKTLRFSFAQWNICETSSCLDLPPSDSSPWCWTTRCISLRSTTEPGYSYKDNFAHGFVPLIWFIGWLISYPLFLCPLTPICRLQIPVEDIAVFPRATHSKAAITGITREQGCDRCPGKNTVSVTPM